MTFASLAALRDKSLVVWRCWMVDDKNYLNMVAVSSLTPLSGDPRSSPLHPLLLYFLCCEPESVGSWRCQAARQHKLEGSLSM